MPNPQQPELVRAGKDPAGDAVGPVPEDNRPGHRPDVVPDKPVAPPAAYRLPGPEGARGGAGDSTVRFAFGFEPLLAPLAAAVGVLPVTAWVRLDDDELVIRFGPWRLRTARDNIAGCEVTGPYRALRVAGPPRLSLADRGVTFATNRRAGACLRFHRPVAGLLPWGLLRHPGATVTVANPADLARRLTGD